MLRTMSRLDDPDQPIVGESESLSEDAKRRIKSRLLSAL
jgi:hypothetical protein